MTLSEFNQFKNEINKYIGKEITYTTYVASADRDKVTTGTVARLDDNNKDCVVIAFWGRESMVHYSKVLNY